MRTALFGRLALVALGTLLGLLLVEVGLHAGAWYMKASGRAPPGPWLTGNRRILCLGDSNTYGLNVRPTEAYPEQLEGMWNASVSSPKIEVINLAFPGVTSGRTFYGLANAVLREVARATNVPLIDLTKHFHVICPHEPCPYLLFRDGHPNPRGYRLIAELVMAAEGGVSRSPNAAARGRFTTRRRMIEGATPVE